MIHAVPPTPEIREMRSLRRILLVAALLVVFHGHLWSQESGSEISGSATVSGRILDRGTAEPVEEAVLRVIPDGPDALSDGRGNFVLEDVPSGAHELEIHHVAYGTALVPVTVAPGDAQHLVLRLRAKAIELAPLEVTVEREYRRNYLVHRGYYERKQHGELLGMGEFLDGPEIQLRGARVSHVLSTIPGVRTLSGQYDGYVHLNRHSTSFHGGPCFPAIYLDGFRVVGSMATRGAPGSRVPRGGGWSHYTDRLGGRYGLNGLVSPVDLAAIEVYKGPASTAGEFVDSGSRCGVVVLWTKHGPDPSTRDGR